MVTIIMLDETSFPSTDFQSRKKKDGGVDTHTGWIMKRMHATEDYRFLRSDLLFVIIILHSAQGND